MYVYTCRYLSYQDSFITLLVTDIIITSADPQWLFAKLYISMHSWMCMHFGMYLCMCVYYLFCSSTYFPCTDICI